MNMLHPTTNTEAYSTDLVLLNLLSQACEGQKVGQAVHLNPQLVCQPRQRVGGNIPSTNTPGQQESELVQVHCVLNVCLQQVAWVSFCHQTKGGMYAVCKPVTWHVVCICATAKLHGSSWLPMLRR